MLLYPMIGFAPHRDLGIFPPGVLDVGYVDDSKIETKCLTVC
jgi:hypothetical protein